MCSSDLPFSRIPLHGEETDDETTYVLETDLLIARARGEVEAPLGRFAMGSDVLAGTLTATIPGALFVPRFDVLIRPSGAVAQGAPAPAREPAGEAVPAA